MNPSLSLPVIPESVTVHLGPPDANVGNVTLPFPDYIKNVASSEIYPTWPENALRANIYAQISFALNRIYTEFYRSRGYNFDITNSTATDQFFVPNRDIFENISRIVDEIFDSYVVRQGSFEPLFTQYCNGTTSVCDGLSQWGTVPLAEDGLSPIEILRRFYGNDIEIVTDVPVENVTESVPLRPLTLGSTGDDVKAVQVRLNRISTNYPAIPKISPVDGVFGENTRQAVLEFQRVFGLTQDGVVGRATWYRILFIFNAVKRLSELNSEGLTFDEISRQFPEELSVGSQGNEVRLVQYFLNYVAAYSTAVPPIAIDGIYGQNTRDAVTAFQRLAGIPETGVIDELTYSVLYDAYRGILNSLPDSQFIGIARPFPGFVVTEGQSGEYVLALQEYLNVIAQTYPQIPEIAADGIFGPATANAVRAFQSTFGLPVTGNAGFSTWDAIGSLYEDLVKGSVVAEGQYSMDLQ
ncbi:MAG: spore cortex-lytic protein [Ruminococcaceae bacterium]|nr:spore cortex-lytic protein [Oscillospiraceae bacterium]